MGESIITVYSPTLSLTTLVDRATFDRLSGNVLDRGIRVLHRLWNKNAPGAGLKSDHVRACLPSADRCRRRSVRYVCTQIIGRLFNVQSGVRQRAREFCGMCERGASLYRKWCRYPCPYLITRRLVRSNKRVVHKAIPGRPSLTD